MVGIVAAGMFAFILFAFAISRIIIAARAERAARKFTNGNGSHDTEIPEGNRVSLKIIKLAVTLDGVDIYIAGPSMRGLPPAYELAQDDQPPEYTDVIATPN